MDDPKETLVRYLTQARDAVVWKTEGLSERQLRWPHGPTAANLLGVVKHLACMEYGYLGEVFSRPAPERIPASQPGDAPNDDMVATAQESAGDILAFYARACAHADTTIATLELDAVSWVPWWDPTKASITLHHALVRMVTETTRHAGQMDILRELTDGAVGWRRDASSMPEADELDWPAYRARVANIASSFPA